MAAELAAPLERSRDAAADETSRTFRLLIDRHLDAGYRLAAAVLGDAVEAQDVAHDAALLAWRRFGTLRELERFEAWYCRIVVNVCRDRLRSRRRHPVTELRPEREDAGLVGRDDEPGVLARDALDRAFPRLQPDHQVVLALRFSRDLSLEEVAERLDIPVGTVKSRLHHALARLRAELVRQGWRQEDDRG